MKTKTPTRTRIGRAISAVLVSAALGLPASAAAENQRVGAFDLQPEPSPVQPLPHPKDPTINVPGSIGGVGLGGTIKNAAKAWGSSKKDCAAAGCSYGSPYDDGGTAEISVDLEAKKARVVFVAILASDKREDLKKPLFEPALGKFKTKEGIGLGSRVSKLKEAYPEAKKVGKGCLGCGLGFEVKGKHNRMTFGFDQFNGHNLITSVEVRDRN